MKAMILDKIGKLSQQPDPLMLVDWPIPVPSDDVDKLYLEHLNYPAHLWMEKEIKSVANITRQDVQEFLQLAAAIPIRPEIQSFALKDANEALREMKAQKIRGAKVLCING